MLKLHYFGHMIQRADSLGKTVMLGKIEDFPGGSNGKASGRGDDRG